MPVAFSSHQGAIVSTSAVYCLNVQTVYQYTVGGDVCVKTPPFRIEKNFVCDLEKVEVVSGSCC